MGGEWGSNGRRLPICALTSGVSCQGQRPGREPTGMRPGRPTALAAGARYAHSHRESPASRAAKEESGRASRHPRAERCSGKGARVTDRAGRGRPGGREPPPSPGRRFPRASGAARGAGAGCGRDPGAPAGSPAPCARPPRGFRHGPRAPARPPRWQGVGAPAPTESASRAYAWGEFSGTRELGAGIDCQKVHRACTRGMRLLTRDRPAVAFPC